MGDTLPHGAPEFRQISLDMCDLRVVVPPLTCGARHCLGCFLQGFMCCWDGYWCASRLKRDKAIG